MTLLMDTFMRQTSLRFIDLMKIIESAPKRYKTYQIPKRTGGFREISQPSVELKLLQRILSEEVLSKLPVHTSAMAYRKGISIKDNATTHIKSKSLLKFDFCNFFPSISELSWKAYCNDQKIFDDEFDIYISTKILFKKYKQYRDLRLSIGAPTSPLLSNILLYNFDSMITKSLNSEVSYTRYADDLTFSAPRIGYYADIIIALKKTVATVPYPNLVINNKKTVQVTNRFRRSVTGLILSNDGRVTIGHQKKRDLRAKLHNAINGSLTKEEISSLIGYISFARSIEPDYMDNLLNKYNFFDLFRNSNKS